jgi:hypothetical protein
MKGITNQGIDGDGIISNAESEEDHSAQWVVESDRYDEDHHHRNPMRGWVTCHDDPRPLAAVAETLSGLLKEISRTNRFWQSLRMPRDETNYRIRNVVTGEIIPAEAVEVFASCNLPIDNPTLRNWFAPIESGSSEASSHSSTSGQRRFTK